jgi:hypothetical protein
MVLELHGEYTNARILVDDEELVEDDCLNQIQELIDHPAFTEQVRIMPDTHPGSGAPIGFTMPLPDRVVPNIVGIDVGCGMAATNLGERLPLDGPEREQRVREAVPMGHTVHDERDDSCRRRVTGKGTIEWQRRTRAEGHMPTPDLASTRPMWPWGHAAVGYLLYAGYRRVRSETPDHGTALTAVTDAQVLALAVATQLPDLIDKPLAWQFDVLPNGRSAGHSLIVFALLAVGAWLVFRGTDRRGPLGAFGLGYLSHLGTDGLYPALSGSLSKLGYLGYPLVPPIEYPPIEGGFLAHLFAIEFGATGVFELGLTLVAMLVWYADGMPGLRALLPSRFGETDKPPEY